MILQRASVQNRIGWINHAIFDHCVDVGSILDVAKWIRIENDEVGKMALFDLANMRIRFAGPLVQGKTLKLVKKVKRVTKLQRIGTAIGGLPVFTL